MTGDHEADITFEDGALDRLLRPERIAIVGASDKNLFSRRAFAQHARMAAGKDITLVNPRSPKVHGVDTVPSCTDIPGGIDSAFLMTPRHATADALRDAVAGGAKAAVILSQGWAEAGPEGKRFEQELVELARELDVILLGPNHLGFANLWDGVALCALGLEMPIEPGNFALVSQSGAVGSSLVGYAARNDVRFSFVVTTGNEAMVSMSDVVNHLVDDDNTHAIGVFAESIRKPEVFRAAARKAADRGKAIVILKAGASELAAETAKAHTGALVGDDRVIDAMLAQEGVIRVKSVEDLIVTGSLCATIGSRRGDGVGVISVSGGSCDIVADQGDDAGLRLPTLSDGTKERLAEILPSYGHPQNPLDITGSAATRPDMWRDAVEAMGAEPEIALIGAVTSLPTGGEPQRAETFYALGEASKSSGVPVVVFPQMDQPQSDAVREIRAESGVAMVLPGVERFVRAATGWSSWCSWLRDHPAVSDFGTQSVPEIQISGEGAMGETESRALLEDRGIPFVPTVRAASSADAVAAAAEFDSPVVLKLDAPSVSHKTELGGVELNLRGDQEVKEAYDRIVGRAQQAGVTPEGVLVSPMRSGGVELLVGVTTDPDWGQVLAVAFGGALVELLDDTSLRLMPVTREDVLTMLSELRGSRLLTGFRGSEPVDLDALSDVIVKIADVARAAGDGIESLEINPLLVDGARIEALDALIVRPGTSTHAC